MKKLLFREILICSHKERRAKKVIFDQKRTLIYGKNDTGKSSLIKSIFITFGAPPNIVSQDWKDLMPISIVKFSVDDHRYAILRDGKAYAIFDSADKIIRVFKSVTSELGPFLADLLGFRLMLTDKLNKTIVPPPAFIFLPFYVDQDTSWSSAWNAFGSLQQFPKPKEATALYHVGIRPNEYYEAKEFNIDPEEFKEDVKELLIECSSLKEKEELHKRRLVEFYNKKITLETQIGIAEAVLREADKDYNFATAKLPHTVECPTCGAEYENSFSTRFELAQDSDRCKELIHDLNLELQDNEASIDRENSQLSRAIIEVERIEILLQKKKGEIELRDVIESAGRNEVKQIFESRTTDLSNKIAENSRRQMELTERLKGLEDKERRNSIVATYRTLMTKNLQDLEVTRLPESSYKNIAGKINDTGSSLPRALTAYYFSIFEVIKQFSTSVYCPLVIDSPNQQAQDLSHIDLILKFINESQPDGTQLILGLEELYNMDFNCPVIELTEKHQLLSKDEFSSVNAEVGAYLDQINTARGRLF
jgi:hypothetical protein